MTERPPQAGGIFPAAEEGHMRTSPQSDRICNTVRVTGIKITVTSDNDDVSGSATTNGNTTTASDDGAGWSRPLHKPVELPGGMTLKTLAEAGAYILDLPEHIKQRDSWRRATDLLLKAASGAASVKDATAQIEHALFTEMTLLLSGQNTSSILE
jgi:hypothetical protein